MAMSTPKQGERYTHKKWTKGTPDAVVGEVVNGYVRWSEKGGCEIPGLPVRFLTEEYGWIKVSTKTPIEHNVGLPPRDLGNPPPPDCGPAGDEYGWLTGKDE